MLSLSLSVVGVVTGRLGTFWLACLAWPGLAWLACRSQHAVYGPLREILGHYHRQLNIKYARQIMHLLQELQELSMQLPPFVPNSHGNRKGKIKQGI